MTYLDSDRASQIDENEYRTIAREHLWRHNAEMSDSAQKDLRIMVRGEGSYLIDANGARYLDAVSNLFCVNLGYSHGEEMGQAALEQYRQLGYHSNWGSTHPRAIELAQRLADLAPADLNHVFLTPNGGESVETAWKIARQYYKLRGENRWKAITRDMSYHGTTLGALSLSGIPAMRAPFEPLLSGVARVRNTRRFGRPADETEEQFTSSLLAEMEHTILAEDPSTVAMIMVEPIQNNGGMLIPPAGYVDGLRALADKYDLLLVADETITGFGRVGAWFASERVGLSPDILTTAKGLSSAHAVIGAVIVNERVFEPFKANGVALVHGNTFGGHPVMAAVALKNIEIMERLKLRERVRELEGQFEQELRSLEDLDVVADVRGTGYFWGIELTSLAPDGRCLTQEELNDLYARAALAGPVEDLGVILRVQNDPQRFPVIMLGPPLVAGPTEFALIRDCLRTQLTIVEKVWRAL